MLVQGGSKLSRLGGGAESDRRQAIQRDVLELGVAKLDAAQAVLL